MKPITHANRGIIAVLALLSMLAVGAIGELELSVSSGTVGGGGHGESGAYVLDGSIGQPILGTGETPPYTLCGGFWCGSGRYRIHLPSVLRASP